MPDEEDVLTAPVVMVTEEGLTVSNAEVVVDQPANPESETTLGHCDVTDEASASEESKDPKEPKEQKESRKISFA